MSEFDDRWPQYDRAMGGRGQYDPAVGHMLATNPAAAIQALIAKGVPPPPDIPEGASMGESADTLGRHLSSFAPQSTTPGGGFKPPFAITPPVEGNLAAAAGINDIGKDQARVPKSELPGEEYVPTPRERPQITAQGAAEEPEERRQPPTPAPESAQATVDAAAPERASGQVPPEGQDSKPKKKSEGGDLGAVLAGLSAIKPPAIPHLATPPPYHATNQISRSNIPQVLMQELTGAARPASVLRLGQALKGG